MKVILFDLGGVIVDDFRQGGHEKWSAALRMDPESFERVYQNEWNACKVGKGSDEDAWRAWHEAGSPLSPQEIFELHEQTSVVVPGIAELLRKLKEKYVVAAFSNDSKSVSDMRKRRFHLDDYFNPIIVSCEIGVAKPDKRAYERAVEILGVRPGEIVFVDNKEKNLVPARAIGMKTILFKSAEQTQGELESMGLL